MVSTLYENFGLLNLRNFWCYGLDKAFTFYLHQNLFYELCLPKDGLF